MMLKVVCTLLYLHCDLIPCDFEIVVRFCINIEWIMGCITFGLQ